MQTVAQSFLSNPRLAELLSKAVDRAATDDVSRDLVVVLVVGSHVTAVPVEALAPQMHEQARAFVEQARRLPGGRAFAILGAEEFELGIAHDGEGEAAA